MPQSRLRSGVTPRDLIVVIATLTVCGSVLLPAMSRAREGERSAACLGNLRQIGYGVNMYVADQAGWLPGPTHLTVPNAQVWATGNTQMRAWYKIQFLTYVAPYIHGPGVSEGTRMADLLAVCPTSAGIPSAPPAAVAPYFSPKSYYVLNSGRGSAIEHLNVLPYYSTTPVNYFGYLNVGEQNAYFNHTGPFASESYRERAGPKRLDTVNNPSTEWAVADLWYWEVYRPGAGIRPAGTWAYMLSSAVSGSISNAGMLKVPSYPFHLTSRTYSADVLRAPAAEKQLTAPRMTIGRTNQVYLDGHADGVQNWAGTANPCFDANYDNLCD